MQYHEMVCPSNYLFVNDRVVVVEAIREAGRGRGGGRGGGEVRRERGVRLVVCYFSMKFCSAPPELIYRWIIFLLGTISRYFTCFGKIAKKRKKK